MNTYPAATAEFLPITVTETVDGTTTPTTDYQVAIVAWHTTSADVTEWDTPTTLGDETGVIVTGLEPGRYAIWTKVTDNPETIIQRNGYIRITP